jgi:hypothetical protein
MIYTGLILYHTYPLDNQINRVAREQNPVLGSFNIEPNVRQ